MELVNHAGDGRRDHRDQGTTTARRTARRRAPNNSVTVTASARATRRRATRRHRSRWRRRSPAPPRQSRLDRRPRGGQPGIGIYQHAAAASGSRVYATWVVNPLRWPEVKLMVARSDDGGATWAARGPGNRRFNPRQGTAETMDCPAVAIDAGNPDVVYTIGDGRRKQLDVPYGGRLDQQSRPSSWP